MIKTGSRRVAIFFVLLLALTMGLYACGGGGGGDTGDTAATLDSIAVTPTNPSIALGTTQPFTAMGTYSDLSTQNLTTSVTWSSSDDLLATVSSAAGSEGLATSVAVGTATITATSGLVSGNTNLTVMVATAEGTIAVPQTVIVDTPYSGGVDTTVSYYVATVTAGQPYAISVRGMSDNVNLYVYDNDSTYSTWVCRPWIGGTTDEVCTVIATGTEMYILVNGIYTSAGATYTLDVTALLGTPYYIETFPNGSGSSADTYLYLYASDGTTMLAANDDRFGSLYSELLYFLESGQTYYVEVFDYFVRGDFYSIAISASGFGASSAGTPTDPDSYEPDDTSGTATTLVLDAVQDHSLTVNESDWFVFVAP